MQPLNTRRTISKLTAVIGILVVLLSMATTILPVQAHTGDLGSRIEYPLPTANSDPIGITVGPDGNLWFTEASTSKIGSISTSGSIKEYSLSYDSQPDGITVGPDGNLWFTEQVNNKIGSITTSGTLKEYSIPTFNSDPLNIALGSDGNLWFTENYANKIGSITPSGNITEYRIPTANSEPVGITVSPDGNLWFTEAYGNKIGSLYLQQVCHENNRGMEICYNVARFHEYPIPTAGGMPVSIARGSDGNLWFTEWYGNKIGEITSSGTITEFSGLTANSLPEGITLGANGMWFTECSGNKIGQITYGGRITELSIPTIPSCPSGITYGPDGNLWFTEAYGNKIGSLTPPGLVP